MNILKLSISRFMQVHILFKKLCNNKYIEQIDLLKTRTCCFKTKAEYVYRIKHMTIIYMWDRVFFVNIILCIFFLIVYNESNQNGLIFVSTITN